MKTSIAMTNNLYRGANYAGQFRFGNLIVSDRGTCYIYPSELIKEDGHHLYFDTDDALWVTSETVSQYIGLDDLAGVKIFGGDIVYAESYNPAEYVIEYIEGGWCATNELIKGLPIDINHFYSSIGCSIKVIGNIYGIK
jgi:hypothetical protein